VFPERPKIAVVGAGALGGYYGARLAQSGHDVHFLLRSDYEAVRRNGWAVRSFVGDFQLGPDRAHVYNDPREMPPADLVLVTLKTTANDQYEPLIRPLLKDGTAILTIQNGLGNEDRLAELFGGSRILGGMAFVCINRDGPGIIHHIDHGTIRLGEFRGGLSDRASRIAKLFNDSRVTCEVLEDLRWGRWSKLVWNIPFNGLGAVLDLTTDRLLADAGSVQLVTDIMREVIEAAEAQGLRMPADMIDRQITHTRTMGPYRSSMQIDRQEGRPLEVESILGEPFRQARAAGIKTPKLEMLYEMARLADRMPLRLPHRVE
jgi:2-dehydropantoate 2-reductase